MGRMYYATIDIDVTGAADTVDIFELRVPTAGDPPIALHEFLITTDVETDASELQIELALSRRSGAWTVGTGGGTPTARPRLANDAAATASAIRTGATGVASGGTEEALATIFVNNRIGFHWLAPPEGWITAQHDGTNDEGIILAQTGDVQLHWGGYLRYEELI